MPLSIAGWRRTARTKSAMQLPEGGLSSSYRSRYS
jgi:hypothetical protein